MVKYLRPKDLSSQDKDIKIVTHLGSTTNNMMDYIEIIIRKKTNIVRVLVKCVSDIDKKEEILIDFSSNVSR